MDKETFIEDIFEIAFGDNAINKNYTFEEVVERVRNYSDRSYEYGIIEEFI